MQLSQNVTHTHTHTPTPTHIHTHTHTHIYLTNAAQHSSTAWQQQGSQQHTQLGMCLDLDLGVNNVKYYGFWTLINFTNYGLSTLDFFLQMYTMNIIIFLFFFLASCRWVHSTLHCLTAGQREPQLRTRQIDLQEKDSRTGSSDGPQLWGRSSKFYHLN